MFGGFLQLFGLKWVFASRCQPVVGIAERCFSASERSSQFVAGAGVGIEPEVIGVAVLGAILFRPLSGNDSHDGDKAPEEGSGNAKDRSGAAQHMMGGYCHLADAEVFSSQKVALTWRTFFQSQYDGFGDIVDMNHGCSPRAHESERTLGEVDQGGGGHMVVVSGAVGLSRMHDDGRNSGCFPSQKAAIGSLSFEGCIAE